MSSSSAPDPAGATAARALALVARECGLSTALDFRATNHAEAPSACGRCERFPHLAPALDRIPTRLISRLHLESPNGEAANCAPTRPAALMIRRVEFDELLVRLAQEAGAELVEGVEITQVERTTRAISLMTRKGERMDAPLVIAADGANSVIARRLGMNRGWRPSAVALDMMEETPFESLACADPDLLMGGVRIQKHAWLCLHISQARSRERRCRFCPRSLPQSCCRASL